MNLPNGRAPLHTAILQTGETVHCLIQKAAEQYDGRATLVRVNGTMLWRILRASAETQEEVLKRIELEARRAAREV
jgi:hypothetical protein